ncbi:MAG: DNA primase [Chloroflexota bacterium]
MSATDEIKSRLDIVNYIGQYVPLKKAGKNYKACCPFHAEKTPSFFVNPETQTWRCFGACAEGGDIFSFAQKYNGWDFKDALRELAKQAGVDLGQESPADRQKTEHLDRLRGLLNAAADIYHQALVSPKTDSARAAQAYAQQKRGFSDETITTFAIGYAPPGWQNMLDELTRLGFDEDLIIEAGMAIKNDRGRVYDRFRNRLMIPIRDDRGRVVGFGARALDPEDNPKYLNSPQTPAFDKSRVLFGLDTAKRAIRDSGTAVLVEGYMDAIQAQQAGFQNVVAQMGTAMTETQLKMLVPRYAQRVILALDADAAGQNATRRSLETARQTLEADYAGRMSVDIRVLQIPEAKDPDDLIREQPEQWAALVEQATPVADYVIQVETADLPQNASLQEREAVARRVLPILVASENNLYTQDNIQKLAMRLRIGEQDLLSWASEQRRAADTRKQSQPKPRSQSQQGQRSAERQTQSSYPQSSPVYYDEDVPEGYYEALSLDPTIPLPDDLHEADGPPAPVNLPSPSSQPQASDRNQEAYCLRMLFWHPDVYYQVNRKLRELAQDDTRLLNGPLAAFGVGDFTRGDFRALMQMFLYATRQDEKDVLDFLHDTLDPAMYLELDRLMVDEGTVLERQLQGRFDADRLQVWKQYDQRVRPGFKPEAELLLQALELRRRRLKLQLDDYRFAQMDSRNQDTEMLQKVGSAVLVIRQAMHRLDEALQEQRRQFA